MNTKSKILIVDDKPENLHVLETLLKDLDVEIVKALNGLDALKATIHHRFALAIIDIQMPEMDGYELAKFIRSEQDTRHLPIIFLSALYSDEFHIFKGYEAGAVDFLSKPYNPEILLSKINVFVQIENQKNQLENEILLRNKVEEELLAYQNKLEEKVRERTKELEETTSHLIQSEKMFVLGELSAGIVHEVNQPLSIIKVLTQVLLKNIKGDDSKDPIISENLNDILSQINKLSQIIEKIKVFSHTNTVEMTRKVIILNNFLESFLRLFTKQLSQKNIELIKHLGTGIPLLHVDPVRIEQVLMNIMTNAQNAVEANENKNKTITISTFVIDKNESPLKTTSVCVSIQDSGDGVPDDLKEKIFHKFFTTKEPGKGTGLGLPISRTILEEHHGTIELICKDGQGAIFNIILPASDL
jgi:C4-dicarboxylate-specific signal transduction histidine kinase